jgi:hypothetical protein
MEEASKSAALPQQSNPKSAVSEQAIAVQQHTLNQMEQRLPAKSMQQLMTMSRLEN